MVLAVHIIVGAAIVGKTKNPLLGLFLAFLSHYIIDFLPHQEYSIINIKNRAWRKSLFDFLKVFIDMTLGFATIILISKNIGLALLGGFLGIVPDGLTLLFLLFPEANVLKKHFNVHRTVFHLPSLRLKEKYASLFRISVQVIVSIIALFFLPII